MKHSIDHRILRHLLRNCHFITGTAYAGKSTAVRLLAERHGGICCGENYTEALHHLVEPAVWPCLGYFETMSGWREFVTRSPEEYAAWIAGCSEETAEFELAILLQKAAEGRPVFVDTNLSLEILREIAAPRQVAVMLAPPKMSVDRFFEREDAEKQMLYRELMACPDPEAAMENYRQCLMRINSEEACRRFEESGFFVWHRREDSRIEEALTALERHFGLGAFAGE
ncbi:MAG: hypothetical protein IJC43_01840 [Clostridia bacterium]|nr:hypothetical protein [Clostridia bacterium]